MEDVNMLPLQLQRATRAISVATAALQVTHTVLQKLCLRCTAASAHSLHLRPSKATHSCRVIYAMRCVVARDCLRP